MSEDVTAGLRTGFFGGPAPRYRLTRFCVLRGLGFVYSVAFAVLCAQLSPLLGSRGVLPAASFVERVRHLGFWSRPTLFWLGASDGALAALTYLGLGLSLCVLLGVENAAVMAALWVIYLSFCHVGQIFYGYGWEILLLEAGFLSIFLCPLRSLSPLAGRLALSPLPIWLLRWLLFRVMFGAGLIKLRGDECWRELTCLSFHCLTSGSKPSPLGEAFRKRAARATPD